MSVLALPSVDSSLFAEDAISAIATTTTAPIEPNKSIVLVSIYGQTSKSQAKTTRNVDV